jgi:asparagine synthase (glutamine-hydrolysing)
MVDHSGNLALVFNGEIYNYRALREELEAKGHSFASRSDTEVIIAAYREWGAACVGRFDGMFAYALYDEGCRQLLIARDRAGEKPLYYRDEGGSFVFASELKALMEDPSFNPRLDPRSLNHFLAYGYVPGEMCILAGVKKLPPATLLTFDLESGAACLKSYWSLPYLPPPEGADEEELVERLHQLMRDSLSVRMVADVPVGILLSGGIDSSLITAIAAEASIEPLRTFTVTSPGHPYFDEAHHARIVASHFGTRHTEMVAEPPDFDLVAELARQFDEPIADSSMIPTYLVARLIRQQATVAVGGDGGDELFGGYRHYSWLQAQDYIARHLPSSLMNWLGGAAARVLPVGLRGRHYLTCLAFDPAERIAKRGLFFDGASRRRLLQPGIYSTCGLEDPERYVTALCPSRGTTLQKATMVDLTTYLVEDLLVKLDRCSMLTSLEIRTPYLDHKIIEFAFTQVPDRLRATTKARKILPKALAAQILPATLDLTRKKGFSIPLRAWFKDAGWGAEVEAILRDADKDLFNRAFVDSLVSGQNRAGVPERLLGLAIFELWRREYKVRLPA